MSHTDSHAPVDVLIAECAEALRNGKRADCLAIAEKHPEHASEISAFINDFDRMEKRFAPLRELSDGTPCSAAEVATIGQDDTAVPPPPKAGGSFGDYDLLSEVARGGMGVVYKARQKSLNRVVALKMVLGGQRDSSNDRDRFLVEARAVARLNHPHIVPIYEVGERDGQPYFTMEFFSGGSLRDQFDKLRGDQRAVARLMVTVARAVEHAHRRGILHRDIKPNNVLLDERGEPHVTDFGLAKQLDEESDLTQAGAIVGTPSYMAPEQANAETDLTTAADVYGLGALMYELLTGRPPFKGNTPLETMMAAFSQEPQRPRKLAAEIEADLETICLKCLEKDPLARYNSADSLADDLERWLDDKPIHARPVTVTERLFKWSRRQPLLAGSLATVAAAAMGLIILAGFLWQNAEARAEMVKTIDEGQQRLAQVDDQRKQAELNKTEAEKLADEQRTLAEQQRELADKIATKVGELQEAASTAQQRLETARREARANKYAADMSFAQNALNRRDLGNAVELLDRQRPMPHEDDLRGFEWHYFWRLTHRQAKSFQQASPEARILESRVVATAVSADGHTIAAAMGNTSIKVWNAQGGEERHTIAGPENVVGLSFSADGKRLTAIAEVDKDDNALMRAVHQGHREPPSLKLLGRWYQAYTWSLGESARPQTAPLDPSKLDIRLNPRFSRRTGHFLWGYDGKSFHVASIVPSPDGSLLAFGGMSQGTGARLSTFKGLVVLWDVKAGKIKRQYELSAPADSLDFSPDGKSLAIAGAYLPLEIWDFEANEKRLLNGERASGVSCVQFSHDGRLLATGAESGTIQLWDSETGEQEREFLGHQAAVTSLGFLPDDRALVSAGQTGAVNLWRIDQPNYPLRLRGAGAEIHSMAFSEDGRDITSVYRTGAVRSWDTTTGQLRRDIKGATVMRAVVLSPDGQVRAAVDKGELKTTDFATGRERTLGAINPRCLVFSPDGKKLAAIGTRGVLRIWHVSSGKPLGEYEIPDGGNVFDLFASFAPDGQTIAFPREKGVLLWNPSTGEQQTLPSRERTMKAVFSPDGRLLATTSNRELAIWDVSAGKQVITKRLPERNAFFNQMAFSPDGKRLALAAAQSETAQYSILRMWDVRSGQEVMSLPAWKGQVISLVFSKDGQRLAAASMATDRPFQASAYQATVTIWNTTPADATQ